jgi:hypothetical protein
MNSFRVTTIRIRACEKAFFVATILVLLASTSFSKPAAEAGGQKAADVDKASAQYEKKWGLRPLELQLSAGGYMLDFRYHVVDGEKAAPLFSTKIMPYLIVQASGEKLSVAETQRFGALRQTRKPYSNKNYYIIFGNPAKKVKRGDTVTVVIGDLEIKDIVVR